MTTKTAATTATRTSGKAATRTSGKAATRTGGKAATAFEATAFEAPAGADLGGQRTLTLNRAREELGLDFPEFELALQLGEIATVGSGDSLRVPAREIARLQDADGGTQALLVRIELVSSTNGAELIGISRERLLRLTRAGFVRPVRWYVNRYRALVWLYLASELRDFAAGSPALLSGRLPAAVRESADGDDDQRPRGWRSRRVGQLVRDAPGAWEEAAVWAALLGQEITDSAVPDPYERTRLRRIRAALPSGRPGPLADAGLIRRLTTADHPDEIALGLVALADALGRARAGEPAPTVVPVGPAVPAGSSTAGPAVPVVAGPAAVPGATLPPQPQPVMSAPTVRPAGERPLRSLRRLLRGRRPVTDG
jgi:hypothetical protein